MLFIYINESDALGQAPFPSMLSVSLIWNTKPMDNSASLLANKNEWNEKKYLYINGNVFMAYLDVLN